MKTLVAIITVFLLVSSAFAGETVEVPLEVMLKNKAYIIELQAAYNVLAEELNARDLLLDAVMKENARLKKRASGFWLGASAGIPFPTATASAMYIFNNSIGIMLNAGYSKTATIQAGVMARIGK